MEDSFSTKKSFPEDDSWYDENIEAPIRKVVKNLRNNGINTLCSCGHKMYVECETYDPYEELKTIHNIFYEMGINKYRVEVITECDECIHRFLYILLPDKNGNFHMKVVDNPKFEQQMWDGMKKCHI